MAQPAAVQSTYKAGMKRDGAREALPDGACWNLVDFLPEVLGAVLRKRGGYEYASSVLGGTYVMSGIVAEYTAGQSVLALASSGYWYEIESPTTQEGIGGTEGCRNPIFYNDMVIAPEWTGVNAPKKITRAGATHTLAALGGSPPAGKYALVYKDVVWLGGNAALPKRTYFCVAGAPESWDTSVKWMDMSYPVTGYAALSNAVLVFSLGRTARVRGSIPPPDTDFTIDDPVFEVGCTDNRSIVNYRDKCIFANAQGLYMTDGVALEDLTRVCGMKAWWRDVMKGREGFATGTQYALSWTIAGGVYDDFYFYSICNGPTLIDAGVIDLTRYAWTRLSNIDAAFFFDRLYPQELFWGRLGASRVATIADLFNPTSANKSDADGDIVRPVLETIFFGADPGLKTFTNVFVTYDLAAEGGATPSLHVSAANNPEGATYEDLVPDLTGTGHKRMHLEVNRPGLGISLKIAQVGESVDTRLHDIEIGANPREKSR